MKKIRIFNIVIFIILVLVELFELISLYGEGWLFLINRNFKLITLPLWISLILFGYNSFKKENKIIKGLTIAAVLLFAIYLIISW